RVAPPFRGGVSAPIYWKRAPALTSTGSIGSWPGGTVERPVLQKSPSVPEPAGNEGGRAMTKQRHVAVLPGDGIGPEIVEEGVKVMKQAGEQFGYHFQVDFGLIGGSAVDRVQNPLPTETLQICREADAVLLGAVGGPAWDKNPPEL